MICTYCDSANSETEHRCRRCGRRLLGTAVSAPPGYQSIGATALAQARTEPNPSETKNGHGSQTVKNAGRLQRSAQSSLFSGELPSRVIPFDSQERNTKRPLDSVLRETAEIRIPRRAAAQPAVRKQSVDRRGEQSTLDFLPTAPQTARTLKTTVEAVIYCDARVAPPLHRAMACALDGGVIFLGVGLFALIFYAFASPFTWSQQNTLISLGACALISMTYGFIWAICGRETAGMRWVGMRVINFNGFPPDGKSRALRLVGCWLSYCSGMIGIFWALVDEESLTWHDHMSKTFPALRENEGNFFRQRE